MSRLSGKLFSYLNRGGPALLATVGVDGWAHAVMSWAVAPDPERLRFAVDHGSTTLKNLERSGKVTVQIVGADNILVLIKGDAVQVQKRIQTVHFRLALWETVAWVAQDQTWDRVIVQPPSYQWVGPSADALRRAEEDVLAVMRVARA